jgi:hypothetical protein
MSVRSDLRDALASVVTAALPAGSAVRKRKYPARAEGDPDPVFVVSVGPGRYEPATGEDDAAWFGFYQAAVSAAAKTPMTLGDAAAEEALAQSVRRAVTQPALAAAGATLVDDVDPGGDLPFPRELVDANLDWFGVPFTVRTLEPR